MWKKKLPELDATVRYSPIRRPDSNPVERVMTLESTAKSIAT